jgi:hypothetical protein
MVSHGSYRKSSEFSLRVSGGSRDEIYSGKNSLGASVLIIMREICF